MADKDDDKTKEKADDSAGKKNRSSSAEGKIGILTWMIMVVVVAVLSASGFVLGHLAADTFLPSPAVADTAQQADARPDAKAAVETKNEPESTVADTWYYNNLSSVVVNPDEPGATRFVRVGLILEIDAELTTKKAEELIPRKQPLLINWMNLYFKGLSLDQMEDEADMNRILAQITDAFNEILFPDAKPMIRRTLIREFNIQ